MHHVAQGRNTASALILPDAPQGPVSCFYRSGHSKVWAELINAYTATGEMGLISSSRSLASNFQVDLNGPRLILKFPLTLSIPDQIFHLV